MAIVYITAPNCGFVTGEETQGEGGNRPPLRHLLAPRAALQILQPADTIGHGCGTIGARAEMKTGKMSLRTRAIVANGTILVTLLVELYFYSPVIIGISALVLFLVANLTLLFRAKRERKRAKQQRPQVEGDEP